jgi:hypothetical protein
LETIEREIDELESRETTYKVCERLSWLYVCRDHLRPHDETDERTQALRGSEFLELASGVSYPALMGVLDEHLEAIRVLYPKSYDSLMEKIRALR